LQIQKLSSHAKLRPRPSGFSLPTKGVYLMWNTTLGKSEDWPRNDLNHFNPC